MNINVKMAEGGTNEFSNTIGSELVFNFYCELCKDDGLNVEANGFCVDCKEYLCNICISAHKKSRPTRLHDLLDRTSMPTDSPLPQDRVNRDISTKCKFHSSKLVEFYCTLHDTLGCSTCFATVHKRCENIESVFDKSENLLNSDEYGDFSRHLAVMEENARDMMSKARDNVVTSEEISSQEIDLIKQHREDVRLLFDKLELNLITHVATTTSEEKQRMQDLENELTELSKDIKHLRSEEENLVKARRVCQLYIQMKFWRDAMAGIEGKLRDARENNDIRLLSFKPNIISKESGLGTIQTLNRKQVKDSNQTTKGTTKASIPDNSRLVTAQGCASSEVGSFDFRPKYAGSTVATDGFCKKQDFYTMARSILNKLTHQTFQTVVSQMKALPINSKTKLNKLIQLIIERAISGPHSSVLCANMCRCLSMFEIGRPSKYQPNEQINFRARLQAWCEREFGQDSMTQIIIIEKRENIEAMEPGAMRDELKAELDYEESKARRCILGKIRFIGDLFKLRILTETNMHDCVNKLLWTQNSDYLEYLCQLLTTIGKELDVDRAKPHMDQYFQQMTTIINDKKISSRVRFMLQDVVDLRMNRWIPHQEDNSYNLTENAREKDDTRSSFNLEDEKLLDNDLPLDQHESKAKRSNITLNQDIVVEKKCKVIPESDSDVCLDRSASEKANTGGNATTANTGQNATTEERFTQDSDSLMQFLVVPAAARNPEDIQEIPDRKVDTDNVVDETFKEIHETQSHSDVCLHQATNEKAKTDGFATKDIWQFLNSKDKTKYDSNFWLQFKLVSAASCKPENLPDIPDSNVDTTRGTSVDNCIDELVSEFGYTDITTIDSTSLNQLESVEHESKNTLDVMRRGEKIDNTSDSGDEQAATYQEAEIVAISSRVDNSYKTLGGREENEKDLNAEDKWAAYLKVSNRTKQYDSNFLLQFQFESAAACKPEGLPDIPEINVDNSPQDLCVLQTKTILSELTPDTFETVGSQMQAVHVDSETKLRIVVEHIVKKAISKPTCSTACAKVCRCLSGLMVRADDNPTSYVRFGAVLLARCTREFETFVDMKPLKPDARKEDETNGVKHGNIIDNQRYLGIIRFLGELFKQRMLAEGLMHTCLNVLLLKQSNEQLESLCLLLTTIGKQLDHEGAKLKMDTYFGKMQGIADEETRPWAVRSKLQTVIDLRLHRWVPQDRVPSLKQTEMAQAKEVMTEAVKLVETDRLSSDKTRGTGDIATGGGYITNTTEILDKLHILIVIENEENESVSNWIMTHVKGQFRKNHQFIRALMTAICTSAVTGTEGNEKADAEIIIRRKVLLMKYINQKPKTELHALNALQAFVTKLGHPSGLLRSMFDVLLESGVISEDAFLRWKSSDYEPDGKQACLNEVDQFFLLINFNRLINADTKE